MLSGPSGSGKSTLFRAISGIWPYGEGRIRKPEGTHIMVVPPKPYIPIGTLRAAVTYPAVSGTYTMTTSAPRSSTHISAISPANSITKRSGRSGCRAASSSAWRSRARC